MSRNKTLSKKQKAKKSKLYSYLFHISAQPRKFLQPQRTTWCYKSEEDRSQALVFLCPRREIKNWIEWVISKIRDKHSYKTLDRGGYITLFIHIVCVYTPDLIIPKPRCGREFVVQNRLRPRAVVPIRIYWEKRIDLSKLNSTLKYLKKK